MTVRRIDEETVCVDNVNFQKSGYGDHYISFSAECTDDHHESLLLFLASEESEHYKPTAIELLLDMPIFLS